MCVISKSVVGIQDPREPSGYGTLSLLERIRPLHVPSPCYGVRKRNLVRVETVAEIFVGWFFTLDKILANLPLLPRQFHVSAADPLRSYGPAGCENRFSETDVAVNSLVPNIRWHRI